MTSVRLRLLVLALLPLIVLMPLLLVAGMARWTADYDRVLIANVESDLRIAEQYLARLLAETGTDLENLAGSAALAAAAADGVDSRDRFLESRRRALGMDFLYFLPDQAESPWPVIAKARAGQASAAIDVLSPEALDARAPGLSDRARIDLIPTQAAIPTDRAAEDRGMIVHGASPVSVPGMQGVLVAGILLNRNLDFIDTINALVYLNAVTGGDRQGTATLFLDDVRVSTNVRLFEDVRALGTRVSAAVRGAVLDEGHTWLDRAFVVNRWYISGYLPILDSFGDRVGMLYVGFLEAPFAAAKRSAYFWMLGAFGFVLVLSIPLFLKLAKGIFAPLERMTQTMSRFENGDLSARIGETGSRDEIGTVASHLDALLREVQDRDRILNERVEARTAELRDANAKIEATFRQLVMSEKLASIGEITAGVAHEINNPVAVIQGNVDVIRDVLGPASRPVETELDLIDRQISRIGAIVGKLLQFARPGEYSADTETVALRDVVTDCLILVDHVLSRKAITVDTTFASAPHVRIDPGEIQQVMINLFINAAQAMDEGGVLSIAVEPAQQNEVDGTRLIVCDTGPGISPERIDAVFDPFYTTKIGEGTGLGLSISQTLVQRAGGLISVENGSAGGAVFTVWLPAAEALDAAAQ
ncbi:HAMP domain-containing sensor histidine kinase [Cognatishimia sp. F0-27]|uniref:sensor histidine kinase n=1 Tax=Cognatishimia sp. F0-27 TaxID=2816855 RepID=UPI001D0C1A3B|nr:HAMP domain-containing sensor histidine kinase [Cognatishimia sp. F0-27]MCC1492941.1 cache domain-containing protein [Cognatishimia sp. F0-27]